MKNLVFAAAVLMLGASIAGNAAFADTATVIYSKGHQSVTGVVTDVGREHFRIDAEDNRSIRVDADDLDLKTKRLQDTLSVGAKVTVDGEFDSDGELEAERVTIHPAAAANE